MVSTITGSNLDVLSLFWEHGKTWLPSSRVKMRIKTNTFMLCWKYIYIYRYRYLFSADSFYWWLILMFKEQPISILHNLYQNEMDSFSIHFTKPAQLWYQNITIITQNRESQISLKNTDAKIPKRTVANQNQHHMKMYKALADTKLNQI